MAQNVNFGLWYDFRNPEPWTVPFETLYRDALEQIVHAESQGFNSVWLTEHHFCDDGYTPSPLVIAGAIGARTKTMRIGTNLIVLPLHNPIRIAEDAATLSLLTGGRFDLGVGIGYREDEFAAFGRKLSHRPSLVEEAMTIIRRAWAGEAINIDGKRFQIGDMKVTPSPEHTPRLLLGGLAEPAIDRAARIADGFLSSGWTGQDVYVDALKRHGKAPTDGSIYAGCWAIIAEDPEKEAARIGDHILYQTNQYIGWGAFGPPDQVPLFETTEAAVEGSFYELWDADMAVARLTEMIDTYPQIRDIHFWAQFPGESVESGQSRIDYIAEKVLPRL